MIQPVTNDDKLFALYCEEAREAGCPPAQIDNFFHADLCLQPKQLLAAAAARECDRADGPTEIGYGGARGGGKSAWSMMQLGADDCQRMPGLKCLLLRNAQRSARESLDDLRKKLMMSLPHQYAAYKGMITFPNGSRILSGHFADERDIDAYLGIEYDVIVLEEATLIGFGTYLMILTCCRSSNPEWRPRMYTTTNPGGIGHGWYKRRFIVPYLEGKQKDTRFIPATVDDNRFLNDGYVKTLDSQTGWRNRAWRHGDWEIAAGQFFATFSERHHIVDAIDERRARKWFASFDYGFTHYTCCLLGFWDSDGEAWIVDEHFERKKLVNHHAPAIKSMIGRHQTFMLRQMGRLEARPLTLDDLDYFVAGTDIFAKESDGKSVDEQYRDHGIRMKAANTDRINGAATIMDLMGDPDKKENPQPSRLHIHRRCVNTIEQITSMQHDDKRPEDVMKVDCDDDGNGGDDAYDTLRYGLHYNQQGVRMQKIRGL